MNTPRQLLHQNDALRKWALMVAHDGQFDLWLAYTMAELAGRSLTADQMTGARIALSVMAAMPEDTEPDMPFPKPGASSRLRPVQNTRIQNPRRIVTYDQIQPATDC